MSLVKHAETELRLAGLFDADSDYGGALGTAVLELVKAFAAQGHSGFSAGMVRELFSTLSNWKTLTPLTSNPDEWMCVTEEMLPNGAGPMWQSKRSPGFFSRDGGATWYDLDDPTTWKPGACPPGREVTP